MKIGEVEVFVELWDDYVDKEQKALFEKCKPMLLSLISEFISNNISPKKDDFLAIYTDEIEEVYYVKHKWYAVGEYGNNLTYYLNSDR